MHTQIALPAPTIETHSLRRHEAFPARVARLSARSVTKHFDAYADIDWDKSEHRIHPEDPRWQKNERDPLGATDWYKTQPEPVRARIGLHHFVEQMKIGVEFEAVLARGLLEFSSRLPIGAPELRYAYHELIEEGQHTLMFNEFIARAGLPVAGMRGFEAVASRRVPRLGRAFPELFFLFVLGGETPIDHVQRQTLRERSLHPLLRRVMQIHVTEEARHVCFAESYLQEHVPRLGAWRRLQLRVATPVLLGTTADLMLRLPASVAARYRIPSSVLHEAYGSAAYRRQLLEGLRPVRELCEKLGLITARTRGVWQWMGAAPGSAQPRSRPVPGIIRALPAEWLDSNRGVG